MARPNFVGKTFVGGSKTMKFVKVFHYTVYLDKNYLGLATCRISLKLFLRSYRSQIQRGNNSVLYAALAP